MTVGLLRYSSVRLDLREELWRDLTVVNAKAVEISLDNLEAAVSNGFFGLAAEISDHLRSRAADLLKSNPIQLIRLEIEQMKRFSYMGYKEPTEEAADRALVEIRHPYESRDTRKLGVLEFEAVGYKAWLSEDQGELEFMLNRCSEITIQYDTSDEYRDILEGFLEGMRGRLEALRGNSLKTRLHFNNGIAILSRGSYERSIAHLEVLFAEHLGLLSEWEEAVRTAWGFLNRALGFGLKSHLLLRIVLLLLRAPEVHTTDEQRRHLRFRCWVLVHAMGLSQLHIVFPLLVEARDLVAKHPGWSLFEVDLEAEAHRWLSALDPERMEQALAVYYSCLGYDVTVLPEHELALDVLAVRWDKGGISQCIGIQVKHYHTRRLYKDGIPDEQTLDTLKGRLKERPPHYLPSSFHWHCTSGIHSDARELLEKRLHRCFGDSCGVYFTDLQELVQILVRNPQWLSRILFSVEIGAGYPSLEGATAHGS